MKKYYCEECGERFSEPTSKTTTYEDLYGVGDLFGSKHYVSVSVCPHCGNEEIEEYQGVHWKDVKISEVMSHDNNLVSFCYEFVDTDEIEHKGFMLVENTAHTISSRYLAMCVEDHFGDVFEKDMAVSGYEKNFERTGDFNNPIYSLNFSA